MYVWINEIKPLHWALIALLCLEIMWLYRAHSACSIRVRGAFSRKGKDEKEKRILCMEMIGWLRFFESTRYFHEPSDLWLISGRWLDCFQITTLGRPIVINVPRVLGTPPLSVVFLEIGTYTLRHSGRQFPFPLLTYSLQSLLLSNPTPSDHITYHWRGTIWLHGFYAARGILHS